MYVINLQPVYWDMINSGLKTIEARVNIGKHSEVNKGNTIVLVNENTKDVIIRSVKYVKYYDNFDKLLVNEGTRNVLPNCNSLEECIKVYKSIYRDTKVIKENGVVAIKI